MKNFKTVNELNQFHTFSIWRKLIEECFILHSNLMKLVQIIFFIPVQTAVVERGFSSIG